MLVSDFATIYKSDFYEEMCLELQAILTILEMFVSLSINNNLGIYVCIPGHVRIPIDGQTTMTHTVYFDCWHVIMIWPSDISRHIQRTKEAINILSPDSNGKVASGDGATENSITYV